MRRTSNNSTTDLTLSPLRYNKSCPMIVSHHTDTTFYIIPPRSHFICYHKHYPNDTDRSLNEVVTDKIRKYHNDYNNNPPNDISFITTIVSTYGRLHREFVCLLFLQSHRETDHFFPVSGVDLVQHHQTSSTVSTHPSPHNSNRRLRIFSLRIQHCGFF